ncbi:GNAT family N-acetyltransferase [Rhodoplanes serenus]|uniref:GNAT family N-acetyltransferase n=1 Tax=Rhodoplanes serenus TaxID=200615 RepID=A0A9X4XLM9_9BRAD|nr:GNAT family N-acetyltransferase [Rhodoplanes serenus]MTW16416.1 GNAT family N-acetyltransferase [Rhodoplanes serenus]
MSQHEPSRITPTSDSITVEPLDPADHARVISLRPHPHQAAFVASNAESLEDAADNPACVPLIIRAAGEPVGFAMYALDEDDGNYWIYRLMIDARVQGRGYGRAAVIRIVEMLSRIPGCDRVVLGVKPDNERARRLYEAVGFRPTGEIIDGEIVMTLAF